MKQNFTDRLFCLFRRSKTICVRLRGCLPRSGASLPYRPGIRFVCIICMLPSYPCMRVWARRARQELERAMELFRTCRKPSHRVQSKHHRSAACVWGKMPRSDRNVLETNIDRTDTFSANRCIVWAERLRVIKGAMQNGIYLSLRVTAGRRPAGSG